MYVGWGQCLNINLFLFNNINEGNNYHIYHMLYYCSCI